jgi:hypothetical protein
MRAIVHAFQDASDARHARRGAREEAARRKGREAETAEAMDREAAEDAQWPDKYGATSESDAEMRWCYRLPPEEQRAAINAWIDHGSAWAPYRERMCARHRTTAA